MAGKTFAVPRLAMLREDKFWSQHELAERSEVGRVTIARLETGGTARRSTIRKLAEALGVQPRDLMGE